MRDILGFLKLPITEGRAQQREKEENETFNHKLSGGRRSVSCGLSIH
jgi:hypothetical protein